MNFPHGKTCINTIMVQHDIIKPFMVQIMSPYNVTWTQYVITGTSVHPANKTQFRGHDICDICVESYAINRKGMEYD